MIITTKNYYETISDVVSHDEDYVLKYYKDIKHALDVAFYTEYPSQNHQHAEIIEIVFDTTLNDNVNAQPMIEVKAACYTQYNDEYEYIIDFEYNPEHSVAFNAGYIDHVIKCAAGDFD